MPVQIVVRGVDEANAIVVAVIALDGDGAIDAADERVAVFDPRIDDRNPDPRTATRRRTPSGA